MSKEIGKFRTDKFDVKQTEGLTRLNSCKRMVSRRLRELHQFILPFVSHIEFIRSRLSICSAHVSWAIDCARRSVRGWLFSRRPIAAEHTGVVRLIEMMPLNYPKSISRR